MSTFLIIDGNSIMNRAFYGIKNLSTKNGVPTNAIYGFINTILKLKNEINPFGIVVAFDLKSPTFRHIKFKDYKKNRKGMPEDLIPQFPVLKEILSHMGIKSIGLEGFEADDIIGTFSKLCTKKNHSCVISTGDRDSLQLVDKNVIVYLSTTKEIIVYNEKKIQEIYEVSSSQLIDVKALAGDTSDNIPGVKGIGEKTALNLIKTFGSIEKIYEDIENIEIKPRIKNLLLAEKELAFISKELGTIFTSCEIDDNMENYKTGELNKQTLLEELSKLEMFKIIDRLELKPAIEKTKIQTIIDPEISILVEHISNAKYIDFLVEFEENKLLKININVGNKLIIIIKNNLHHILVDIILSSDKQKRSYDIKLLYNYLISNDINLDYNIFFDLSLAAYLENPASKDYNIKNLFDIYVKQEYFETDEENFNIAYFSDLCDIIYKNLTDKDMTSLLEDIEIPLSKVLADMEFTGFQIDEIGIKEFSNQLEKDIKKIKMQILDIAQETEDSFNINSTQHISNILYNKLELKPKKKTKSGYSTDIESLENLIDEHPIIEKIIIYRKLTKLNSTYVVGFLNLVKNGRIHSFFKQTETRTGRISSIEPNLQNIPIRTELGKNIRKFFIPKPGYSLIDADYSQIELRILAHISNDSNMIFDFKNGLDIHTSTAAKVFKVDLNEVTSELRNRAKAINFGIIYGISGFSLAKDIGVSVYEAQNYIDEYFNMYSGVKSYLDETITKAYETGYVKTLFNRTRPLPELSSSNKNIKMFGERIAMNTPIQGTAADIIKIAMIKVYKSLLSYNINAKIILQIHDELIIEVHNDNLIEAKDILKSAMEGAVDLKVPLIIDIEQGSSWYETKK